VTGQEANGTVTQPLTDDELRQIEKAAWDIRADELDGFYVGNELREHYARIAEGQEK